MLIKTARKAQPLPNNAGSPDATSTHVRMLDLLNVVSA